MGLGRGDAAVDGAVGGIDFLNAGGECLAGQDAGVFEKFCEGFQGEGCLGEFFFQLGDALFLTAGGGGFLAAEEGVLATLAMEFDGFGLGVVGFGTALFGEGAEVDGLGLLREEKIKQAHFLKGGVGWGFVGGLEERGFAAFMGFL